MEGADERVSFNKKSNFTINVKMMQKIFKDIVISGLDQTLESSYRNIMKVNFLKVNKMKVNIGMNYRVELNTNLDWTCDV